LKTEPEIFTRTVISEGCSRVEEEIVGKEMTTDQVMTEIQKEIIFFDQSGGGVTFSGGEPMMQAEFLHTLLEQCKEEGIHTALDTSGYAPPEDFRRIMGSVDVFLYDLKIMNDRLHRKYTSVSNRVILDNLKMLAAGRQRIVIRFPIIPEITTTKENIRQIGIFLSSLHEIKEIDLLPYHNIADNKYKRFNMKKRMGEIQHPSDEILNSIKTAFEKRGFTVKIGG
jgi:pyruvate formate lyase activating enzyme